MEIRANKISFWHPASIIGTVFGVGKIGFAAGTWGSAVGVLLFILYPQISTLLLVPLFFIGWWAASIYAKKTQKDDASEIVVDEVVGQWIAIILGFYLAQYFKLNPYLTESCSACWLVKYGIWFALFRVFDIIKRGPVGWADRNIKGGLGVMLDDVIAGVLAGITSALIFYALTLII